MKFNRLTHLLQATILPIFFFMGTHTYAQVPTTQDCLGAIPVCDYIYIEDVTASGYGNYFEIPNGGSNCPNHCMDGEKNSRWYVWTVVESGDLRFQITPTVQSDDYDWAVFDLTNHYCEDIYLHPEWMMNSCNAAGGPGYQGATGVSSLNGGNANCNNGGATSKWNLDLPVFEGETYVLVVSDWTQTPGGYTLDFSASTAVIFDDQAPFLEYVGGDLITACGTNELFVKFNENVKCSSIQAYDFKLEGPGGPYVIDSLYGDNCALGGSNEREFTLYFTPAIYQGGDYTLKIKDLSFISDACNNYAVPETVAFTIDLESPVAEAGEDIDIAYAATAVLDGSASGGSGNYLYSWEPASMLVNAGVQNPTTISMTTSTKFYLQVSDLTSACVGEDTMWVNVVGGPLSIAVGSSTDVICEGELLNLFATPNGGGGNYSYSWTSNPPYFTATVQNPSDFPTNDVTYIVEVTDGYTTLVDSVSVVVNPKPEANAGLDQVINEGTITILNGSASGGTGAYNYHWEPSSWLEQSNIANPTTLPLYTPTIFSLFVEDAAGCISNTDEMLVNPSGDGLSAFPMADMSEICLGGSATINTNATGGGGTYSYNWTSDPSGFSSTASSVTVTPESTTTYEVTVTDQFLNEYIASITITVFPLPVVELSPGGLDTLVVCVRDAVVLDAGYDTDPESTIYFWTTANYENRYFKATTNGNWIDIQTHAVEVTHFHGGLQCKNTGEVTILFDFNECNISVPDHPVERDQAIQIIPNPNKGTFTIKFLLEIGELELKISDAQGRTVYEDHFDGFKKHDQVQINSGIHQKGLYVLQLRSADYIVTQKMVVE